MPITAGSLARNFKKGERTKTAIATKRVRHISVTQLQFSFLLKGEAEGGLGTIPTSRQELLLNVAIKLMIYQFFVICQ